MKFFYDTTGWYHWTSSHFVLVVILKSRKFLENDMNNHVAFWFYWIFVSIVSVFRLCPLFLHPGSCRSYNYTNSDVDKTTCESSDMQPNPSASNSYHTLTSVGSNTHHNTDDHQNDDPLASKRRETEYLSMKRHLLRYSGRMQLLYFVLVVLFALNLVYFQDIDQFQQGFLFLALYMEYFHTCLISICNTLYSNHFIKIEEALLPDNIDIFYNNLFCNYKHLQLLQILNALCFCWLYFYSSSVTSLQASIRNLFLLGMQMSVLYVVPLSRQMERVFDQHFHQWHHGQLNNTETEKTGKTQKEKDLEFENGMDGNNNSITVDLIADINYIDTCDLNSVDKSLDNDKSIDDTMSSLNEAEYEVKENSNINISNKNNGNLKNGITTPLISSNNKKNNAAGGGDSIATTDGCLMGTHKTPRKRQNQNQNQNQTKIVPSNVKSRSNSSISLMYARKIGKQLNDEYRSQQFIISLVLIIFSSILTIVNVFDNDDITYFLEYLYIIILICQLALWLIFISMLLLLRQLCCSHVLLDISLDTPIEYFFCSCLCCTCNYYASMSYQWWQRCFYKESIEYKRKGAKLDKNIEITLDRLINCLCFCCQCIPIYYYYPRDESKRVITVLNVFLLLQKVELMYENHEDLHYFWYNIGFLALYIAFILFTFSSNVTAYAKNKKEKRKQKKQQKQDSNVESSSSILSILSQPSLLDKLKMDNMRNAWVVLVIKNMFQIVALVTSLYFWILLYKSLFMSYYNTVNKFWVVPLFIIVNELAQYFKHIDYTIMMKSFFMKRSLKGREALLHSVLKRKGLNKIIFIENIRHLIALVVFGSLWAIYSEYYYSHNDSSRHDETLGAKIVTFCFPSLCLCLALIFGISL